MSVRSQDDVKLKQSNVPRIKILLMSQASKSGRRRDDDKGQKEDRMWHWPPLQMGGPGQVLNALQNVFKGERAESWIEEMSARDQGMQGL